MKRPRHARHRRSPPSRRRRARRSCRWSASGYQLVARHQHLIYTVLATAWALFSGPTRYISLATVAFFGIGAYTVAVLRREPAWPAGAADRGRRRHRASRSSSASRRCGSRGVYFVIFTLRPRRTGPPARHLVRDQHHPHASAATSSSTSRRRRSTGSFSRSPSLVFARRLADRPLAARPRAARHRRRRDGGAPCRHRHDARQARAVRAQRRCS